MSTQPTYKVLETARDLIADPARHATCGYAYDAFDTAVDPTESVACRFCSVGAILYVIGVPGQHALMSNRVMECWDALDQAAQALFDTHAVRANDKYPHAAVMRMWDRAIAIAKGDINA